MKLLKSEKCAIIITLVFLALALGFGLGRRQSEPVFIVTESAFAVRPTQSEDSASPGQADPAESVSVIVNINSCSASELEALPGIGPVLAQRIIDYRENNGGFKSIEDITKVQGIGASVYEDIRSSICVE